MAPYSSRNYVLACTIPAAIAVAAYIWVKKKKKRLRIVRQRDEIRRPTQLLAKDLTDVASAPRTSTTTCSNHLVREKGANCSTVSLNDEISLDSEAQNIETNSLDSETQNTEANCLGTEAQNIETNSLDSEAQNIEANCLGAEAQNIETNSDFVQEENKVIETVELETCDSDAQTENCCTLKLDNNNETIDLSDSPIIAADGSFAADNKLDVSIISVVGCEDEINGDNISAELNSEHFDLSLDTETTCSLCDETDNSSCSHNFSFCSSSSVTSSQLRMLDDSFVNAVGRLSSTPNINRTNDTYDKDLSDCSILSVIQEESVLNDSSCVVLCDSSSVLVVESEDDEIQRQQAATDHVNVSAVSSSSLCDGFVEKCQISDECETTKEVSGETKEEPVECSAVAEQEKETDLKTETETEIPLALSPSLSTEEPELQKLTNGHETSAYGSASQSPAEELLESPTASNYSDHNEWSHSARSSDSGKCESDNNAPKLNDSIENMPLAQVYEFEIPSHLCGRMIGFKGQHVRGIKAQTRADIAIGPHPYEGGLKMCAVLGSESEIRAALDLIRKRFPLSKYPNLSLALFNMQMLSPMTMPDTLQLQLPQGVTCDVILSSLVSAGHFFVQQPTHPTYPSLCQLDQVMSSCYLEESGGAPALPAVTEGVICAAEAMGGWFRAQVVYTEEEECDVRFLDYGGYARHSIYSLRQIRSDFMTLPFQANECYLANVVPISESGWTLEATKFFENLAQGQILQAQIMAFAENGIPLVQLYRIQGAVSTFINSELVNHGHASWVDHQI